MAKITTVPPNGEFAGHVSRVVKDVGVRLGLPQHEVECIQEHMPADLQQRLTAGATRDELLGVLNPWRDAQRDAGLPYPHL